MRESKEIKKQNILIYDKFGNESDAVLYEGYPMPVLAELKKDGYLAMSVAEIFWQRIRSQRYNSKDTFFMNNSFMTRDSVIVGMEKQYERVDPIGLKFCIDSSTIYDFKLNKSIRGLINEFGTNALTYLLSSQDNYDNKKGLVMSIYHLFESKIVDYFFDQNNSSPLWKLLFRNDLGLEKSYTKLLGSMYGNCLRLKANMLCKIDRFGDVVERPICVPSITEEREGAILGVNLPSSWQQAIGIREGMREYKNFKFASCVESQLDIKGLFLPCELEVLRLETKKKKHKF